VRERDGVRLYLSSCGRVAARYVAAGVPFRTFRGGEALVVDGHTEARCP
jgi:hypothetical protein